MVNYNTIVPPKTMFYLVCGGEIVPEREKQDREQRRMIYETIISQGLATKDQVVFINGRGQELNPSFRNITLSAANFKMYGPYEQYNTINGPAGFSKAPLSNDNGKNICIALFAL